MKTYLYKTSCKHNITNAVQNVCPFQLKSSRELIVNNDYDWLQHCLTAK